MIEQLRCACDLFHIQFIFDECSDISSSAEVRCMADIVLDALRNPHKTRPDGEWIGGEVARQYVVPIAGSQLLLTKDSGSGRMVSRPALRPVNAAL